MEVLEALARLPYVRAVRRSYRMERIFGLLCVICGFISSVNGDAVTTTAQTDCEKSSIVQALTPTGVNSTSVALRWEAPPRVCGDLVLYEVQTWKTANGSRIMQFTSTSFQSVTVDQLEPNTAYNFSVVAVGQKPSGMQLNGTVATAEATTDPGPVTNLTIQQQNSRSLKFSWKAPKNSALFNICIYITRIGRNQCRMISGEEETITELYPETNYTVRITAVRLDEWNNITARGTSQTTSAKTICETSSPLKIQPLLFTGWSSSYIVLSWMAPTTVCGTLVNISVTFFKRTAINEGNSAAQRYIYGADATQANITSLMANTVYNFTVSAQTREPSGRDSSGAADSVELRTDEGRSSWITEEGGLSWAIAATVAAVASVSVNIFLIACLYRLQSARCRKEGLYKKDISTGSSQVTSTVKSVALTGAPAETKDTFVDLSCGATAKAEAPYASLQRPTAETEAPYASLQRATAETEEPYASLQQSQRTSTGYEPLSISNQ